MDAESAKAWVKAELESGNWDANYPVPLTEFTEQSLRAAIDSVGLLNELSSLGLKPSPLVGLSVVHEFLAHRMRYWDLDAPHQQFFPPASPGSAKSSGQSATDPYDGRERTCESPNSTDPDQFFC